MQNSKRKQNLNKPPSRENANNKLPSFKHLQGGQITPAVSSVTGHLPHVIEGPTSRASSSSSTRWRQTGPAKSELDMLIETTKRDMSYGDMVRRSASKEEADAEQESNASSSKEAGGAAGQSSSQLQTIVENVMKEDPAATAEELSDLVTAAVIENSLNQLADAENAEVRVGQDLLEVSLQEAMDRLLQEDRESVRGDDSRPSTANVSQHQSAQMNKTSTNTSKSKQNKPSMSQMRVSFYPETVPETIAREYKETEDYRDRILTLGSHLGPYARGHLVTAENNDSVGAKRRGNPSRAWSICMCCPSSTPPTPSDKRPGAKSSERDKTGPLPGSVRSCSNRS
ncbi:unnamed protein product [Amoebophrya sp. A120]|nr:unnamed protein product [Amoebophrya sp. A120]|eukprot:GSA120T00002443001.1